MASPRLRYLLVALAALGLLVPASAFTSVTGSRPVQVAVAPDDEAYLGVDPLAPEVSGNTTGVELVTLTNRFSQPVDVTVVAVREESGAYPDLDADPLPEEIGAFQLEPGESAVVTVSVVCNGTASEQVTYPDTKWIVVRIRAEGHSVSAVLERRVSVTCLDD